MQQRRMALPCSSLKNPIDYPIWVPQWDPIRSLNLAREIAGSSESRSEDEAEVRFGPREWLLEEERSLRPSESNVWNSEQNCLVSFGVELDGGQSVAGQIGGSLESEPLELDSVWSNGFWTRTGKGFLLPSESDVWK